MSNKLFLSYISQIAPIVISFIALPIVYSRVPIDDIGRYESTLFLGGLFIVFSKLSLPSVYFRHKLRESTSPENIIKLLETVCLVLAFLLLLFVSIVDDFLSLIEKMYCISLVSLILIEILRKDTQSDENYLLAIKIFVPCAIFVQGIKVLLVLSGFISYSALLSADIMLHTVYLVIYVTYRNLAFNFSRLTDKNRYFGLLDFDKEYWITLYAHHVLSFVNQHFVKILVITYLSKADMALLALSIKVLLPISFSVDALIYWLSPLIFKGKVKPTRCHILAVLGLGALLLFLTELFYEVFFLMIFPETFVESKSIFMILLVGQIFNVVYRIAAVQILASSNIFILLNITIINLLVTVFITYISGADLSLRMVASVTIIQALVQVALVYAYGRYNSQSA